MQSPGTAAPELVVDLPDVESTVALGRRLAAVLRPGDVVTLDGPLGAGKTVLVRGLADGLGVRGPVTSPTFVLVHEHPPAAGPGTPLVHVDAYRLRGDDPGGPVPSDALQALADLDLPVESSVTAVEWGRGLAPVLSPDELAVAISRARDGDVRRAVLRPVGPSWAQRWPPPDTAPDGEVPRRPGRSPTW